MVFSQEEGQYLPRDFFSTPPRRRPSGFFRVFPGHSSCAFFYFTAGLVEFPALAPPAFIRDATLSLLGCSNTRWFVGRLRSAETLVSYQEFYVTVPPRCHFFFSGPISAPLFFIFSEDDFFFCPRGNRRVPLQQVLLISESTENFAIQCDRQVHFFAPAENVSPSGRTFFSAQPVSLLPSWFRGGPINPLLFFPSD